MTGVVTQASVTIRVIGDVALRRPSPSASRFLRELPPADLVVANLEIPLTDRGVPAEKLSVHRAPLALAGQYADLGVDVWTLATNHLLDFGAQGMADTLRALADSGQSAVGAGRDLAESRRPARVETASGTSVSIVNACSTLAPGWAATPQRPGVAPLRVAQSFEYDATLMEEQPGTPPAVRTAVDERDAAEVLEAVAQEAARSDLVLVALHWGVAWPYLPANQGPLAEYQRPFAHRLIDAGADMVIGHHSHAFDGIELYRDRPICYSLGNFAFHLDPPEHESRVRSPVIRPVLTEGPWRRGAVCDLTRGEEGWSLRLYPFGLDDAGDVIAADDALVEEVRERVLALSPSFVDRDRLSFLV